jgi:trk system potassium uptake protein TrkH
MAGNGQEALIHAVRLAVLARYLGQLALVSAVLVLPPLAVASWLGEHPASLRYLGVFALLAASGWLLSRLQAPDRIQLNEAMVIVTLAFALNPLFMSWPLAAYGLAPLDALFEAVSGVTTTGLTTLAGVEGRPRGFLFARAWMQWYGGLGFAVLAVALPPRHKPRRREH